MGPVGGYFFSKADIAGCGAPISQGGISWYTELKKSSGSEPNLLKTNLQIVKV
jgi:hypothetical protein